jgi:DNA-binding winged helix-turn-helix (wHTH) protein/TolB-like protein/thioredoxin-like negative regulator of GroEL
MPDQPGKIYQFGPYRIDVTERILLRDGDPCVLAPRVFDLLALLVENHGHLMEKETLLKALWPDSFVEEANLNVNISTLRKALGESANEAQFIETVPRRGYRFVAPVTAVSRGASEQGSMENHIASGSEVMPEAPEGLAAGPGGKEPDGLGLPPKGSSIARRWVLWSMVLFLALIAVPLAAWRFVDHSGGAGSSAPIRTLAVLPFKSLNGDSADAALEMGMADALITRLSNSPSIVVRSTSSVMRYSDSATDTLSAGRELQVDAVLEGRVQRSENRIRVTVQLLRVANGAPIWAERFDDYFTNIFAVQDSISEKMAVALSMHLGRGDQRFLAKRPTENTEAYQLYVQGQYFYFKYNFEKALGFFQAAAAKDPDYALAYSGLALAYVALAVTHNSNNDFREKAISSASRAVILDPTLDEAHSARGWVKYLGEWDWQGAEQEFQEALRLNPNNAQSRINYSSLLSSLGRHDEALAQGTEALRLDPVSGDVYFNQALNLYLARRYDAALELSKKGREVDATIPSWASLLTRVYLAQSNLDQALLEARNSGPKSASALAYVYAKSGKRREAQEILNTLVQNPNRTGARESVALIYTLLGDKEHALEWLEKAYEVRGNLLNELKVEPLYDSLRSDPRFIDLLHRMRLD